MPFHNTVRLNLISVQVKPVPVFIQQTGQINIAKFLKYRIRPQPLIEIVKINLVKMLILIET